MSKKKKIIIGIVVVFLLLAISTCIYFYFIKEDKKLTNDNNYNKENIEYTYDEDGPGFFCSNKPLGSNPISYIPGEYVYCTISFELNGQRAGIQEIWAEYSLDEDIEYIETLETSSEWTLKEDNNKFHLTTTRTTVYAEYFYQVKFRIKPTTKKDKVLITFKDIKYKDSDNNYYQTTDSVKELYIIETTNYYYKESENNDEFTFYKFNSENGYEPINKYTCEGESCYVYATQCMSYIDLEKGKMFIIDGNDAVLYDFNKGVLGKYALGVEDLGGYFIVRDINTEKYGIIDLDGNVVKDFTSDQFGGAKIAKCFNNNTYSVEYDLITEKKNDKYGIVKITKNETVVEHQFDDIRLFNDKYFKAKVDNNWYLYNLNTSEKIIEEGYKELFLVNDQIMITQIDNYLYIKDYEGNNIIEDKIEVLVEYNENACCGNVMGIYIKEENDIINIYLDEEIDITEYEYKQHHYEYNIKDKKLTKKDSTN